MPDDVLAGGLPRSMADRYPTVRVRPGLTVLHRSSGVRGEVRSCSGELVLLRDRRGGEHRFRNRPGAFALHGEPVTLVSPGRPEPGAPVALRRSAAGALVEHGTRARVAKASRLWFEGDHDALLVERVWGDDLRELDVVGHPYVDVWQSVRLRALGIEARPEVPPGEEWKAGACRRLGWGSPAEGWRRVLAAVDSFADLEPELVGAVESALDVLAGGE